GIADLAVLASGFLSNLGSLNNNLLENNQGAVLIYYGTTAGITNIASPDVVLAAPAPNASTSTANNQAILLSNFSGAGDINGDGYDDLLISSPNRALNSQNTTDGEILVVFGGQNSLWGTTYSATNPFNLGNITPQTSTLTLQFNQPLIATDIPSTSSFSVKNGLNTISVNGVAFNGTNEIILTLASNANISDFLAITYTQPASGTQLTYATGAKVATFTSSSSAVISTSGAPTLSLESYSEYGFMIAGLPNSQAGISLSGGGDVNGDGFSDFIIGAPGNNDNLTYTLFGSDFNNTVSQTGTIGDDVMLGSPTGESFLAGQGDDKIYGKGGLDVVYAGPGDDYVTVTDTYFQRLDGGAGTDLLAFTGYNGQDWDLTTLSPDLRLRNFEILVTEDYGANTLTLNSLTVAQLSSNNTLTLAMDDADTLNLSSDFSAAGTVYQYNQKFYKYTSSTSAATVLVNKGGSRLILNEQGSLVLLSALGEQLWIAENESGNPVTGAVQALMQTDGNFVLYSQAQPLVGAGAAQYALWASNTAGNPGAYLALSNEGGLYVKNSSGAIITALNSMSGDTSFSDLNGGDELLVNQFLGSPFLITQNAPNTNIPKLVLTAETNTTQSMAIAASFATQSKEISTPETQLFANSVTTKGLASNAPTQLFVSNPTGAELDGSLDFTIQRTGDLSKSVLVSYITQDGDGKAGDRYLPVVGQFVFTPNETSKTVTVKIPNNGRFVGDRQFGLLVSLVKEGNDLAELPLSFNLEADANGSQIRRWSMIKNDTQKGLLGGTLQFDTTVSNGQAQINLSVSDIGDFNSFYSYNSQTSTYEELMLNASSTGATFTYSPQKQNDTPDGIQLNLIKDGDRGDVDNIVNGLAKTNGYAGRTIPGLITNNNKTFWAPTTADGQVQWRLIGAPTKNYELGWILVDDQNGMINGLNPTDTGYEAAALARKQVIFQDQNSASNKALTRTLAQESFTNPSDLAKTESQFFGNLENSSLEVNRFYMLYTTEGEKTTFSVTDTPEIQTDSRGYHQLSFNGITAEIGSSTLVIPGVLNQSVQMEASLSRAAAYNNLIALYQVDSLTGGLDLNGDKLIDLKPGDLGYSEAALVRAKGDLTGVTLTTPENLGTTQQTINLLGNNMYGMVIIPNATIEQVLNQNPSNNPNLGPIALFSFGSANPDGISHTARLGSNLFGFEDLVGGGDQDYNDMILQIK
ncbi:MAG: Calx-beta domain-containing protein, partial [Sphaerospermopsis kisseleviana]